MRRVREISRYRFEDQLGHKAISHRVGAAPSTVRETLWTCNGFVPVT